VIKALDNYKINSKLVWDCHQSIKILAECNNGQFLWVPGHKGTEGNKISNQPAKSGSLHPFIGPKPACGISDRVAE
jgi:hypothetical protein